MKRLLLLLALPLCAHAASPFDGTWKPDLSTGRMLKNPEVGWELKDGHFRCTVNCNNRLDDVAADGKDHPVSNYVISDHLSVTVDGDRKATLKYMHGATPVVTCTREASADAMHLTQSCTDYTGAAPQQYGFRMKRVGKPDPAAHKISGTWVTEQASWTGSEMPMQFESTPGGMRITQNGQVTDAKFDGKEYPTSNDPAHTMNVLRQAGPRKIIWLQRNQGRDWGTDELVVAADGQTMTDTYTGHTDGTKTRVLLRRQP